MPVARIVPLNSFFRLESECETLDDFSRALTRLKHRLKLLQERIVSCNQFALPICFCFDEEPRPSWLKSERRYGAIRYVSPSKRTHFSFGIYRHEAKTGCHCDIWLFVSGCCSGAFHIDAPNSP